MPTAGIAGGVVAGLIGIVVVLAIVIVILVLLNKRKKGKPADPGTLYYNTIVYSPHTMQFTALYIQRYFLSLQCLSTVTCHHQSAWEITPCTWLQTRFPVALRLPRLRTLCLGSSRTPSMTTMRMKVRCPNPTVIVHILYLSLLQGMQLS